MALVSLGTATVATNFDPVFLITSRQSPITSKQFVIATSPENDAELNSGVTVPYTIFAPRQPVVSVSANFISNPTSTLYDLFGTATVPYTIFAPRQLVVSVPANFISNPILRIYDLLSPTTVPNTGVGSRLTITSTPKNSITLQKTLRVDRLKVLEITTSTIYNAGNLPVVKNYKPTPVFRPEKLKTTNTVFTNTQALINQPVVSGTRKITANFKAENIRPVKASKLTLKTTTTFITAYSYWV